MATNSQQDAWVAQTLGIELGPVPAGEPGADTRQMLQRLAATWQAAEQRVRGDVEALKSELVAEYKDDPACAAMEKEFEAHVTKMLGLFDGEFDAKLKEAATAKGAALDKMKADLRKVLDSYAGFVASDSVISIFDDNPYVDIGIGKFCESTLKDMARSLA